MRLLVIDTALKSCSVAVSTGDGPPIVRSDRIGQGHAERLFGMIEEAMATAGMAFSDLQRVGVTVGPGSFAGLRVGVAAARGFALVAGCEAVGITTLAAIAEGARAGAGGRPVLASLAAGMGNVYAALFDADGTELEPPRLGAAAEFAGLAVASGCVLAGYGGVLIAHAMRPAAFTIVDRNEEPGILDVLALAARADPGRAPPRPLYLRPPDARPPTRPLGLIA